jgi:hypothetical protein
MQVNHRRFDGNLPPGSVPGVNGRRESSTPESRVESTNAILALPHPRKSPANLSTAVLCDARQAAPQSVALRGCPTTDYEGAGRIIHRETEGEEVMAGAGEIR